MGMDYTAKTVAGLEEILAKELTDIGADDVEVITRGVTFRGDEKVLYKANYLCRTATRILKPIGVFDVNDEIQLYDKVKSVDWSTVFNLDQTFLVHGTLFNSELTHSHYVALKTKDAIVDQFRDKTGKRPWVGKEGADIYIDVHINNNVCTLSLDASGDSLHRRGYRIEADKAPLNEVLAAGMIKLTGWHGEKDFYDPMCGSGTIPIEAAMLAMNIPAGHYRKEFAFMNWANYDAELFKEIKDEADAQIKELECHIFASDRSEKAIGIAKRNLKNTGLHKDIQLKHKYFDSIIPEEKKGILVFNPPYGIRLEEKGEIIGLYKSIGNALKRNFSGFEAWIISGNLEATKFIGLRPSARLSLYNGQIETKFVKFELYDGSKKDMYENQDGEKKEYPKRDENEKKEFRKRDDGERKPFQKRDDHRKPFKKYDDDRKKEYSKREEGDKREFRPRDGGDKKPFRKREDDERKPFRKHADSERKPFKRREEGEKRDFRPRGGDDKKPFRRRGDEERRAPRKREGSDYTIRSLEEEDRTGLRKPAEAKRYTSKPSDSKSKKDKNKKPKDGERKPRPRTRRKPKDEG